MGKKKKKLALYPQNKENKMKLYGQNTGGQRNSLYDIGDIHAWKED